MASIGPGFMSLKELANKAHESFGLPLFQRELNWSWDHQSELLKSIMSGIPIGTILLWEYDQTVHSQEINVRPINNYEKENDDIKTLVLDGQQRVTFLTWLWKSASQDKYADVLKNYTKKEGGFIYLHLDDDAKKPSKKKDESEEDYTRRTDKKTYGRFSIGSKKYGNFCKEHNVVNVQYLLRENTVIDHIIAQFRTHDNVEWIRKLYNGLHQTKVNTFLLGSNVSYGDALLIYERVNVAGTKLKGEDVTEAVFISKWKDLYSELKQITIDLGGKEFKNAFNRRKVMNCLTDELYHTISSKPKDLDVFAPVDMHGDELTSHKVETAFKLIKSSLKRVKKILQESFYLENDKAISTIWPVVISSAYIREHYPKDDSDMGENRGKLARWMALSILRKHYTGGSTNSKVELDLKAVRNSINPWDELYENMSIADTVVLNSATECKKFSETDLGDPNSSKNPPKMSSWLGTLYRAALFFNNTRDPHTRELLRYEDNLQWHHIFPKALFDEESSNYDPDLGSRSNNRAKDFPANLCLISKKTNLRISSTHPDKYVRSIVKGNIESANNLQLNNPGNLGSKKFRKFLTWRQKEVTKYINKFLDDLEGNVKPSEENRYVNHINVIKNKPENQNIEYKASLRVHTEGENKGQVDVLLESVTIKEIGGFLNSGGGTLYIGVTEEAAGRKNFGYKKNKITGIEQDIRSLDKPKKNKVGSFEFLEAHLLTKIANHIILPTNQRFRIRDLIRIEEVREKIDDLETGKSVMAVTVFPWPESNAAFKEKKNSKIAVEYRRDGGSKNKVASGGTWELEEIVEDGKSIKNWLGSY